MELYDIGIALIGVAVLGAVVLPRLLARRAISLPIVYIGFGMLVFSLPLGLPSPDPLEHAVLTERLTELGVILALMGAGLKIDRQPGLKRWRSTWRLLAITMPLTILLAFLLGWWVAGLTVPAALLFGAVIAPTDPVLAADVQVAPPQEGKDDEIRFALTSEAGLNDGLAFPFTYLAVAVAVTGLAPAGWIGEWLLIDVVYRIGAGVIVGGVMGHLLARFVFNTPATTQLSTAMAGAEALAATLLSYGVTEIVGGYGFVAVFVAAIAIRDYEREHEYHDQLHEFAEISERLLMVALLVLFGGAIVTGLLAPLTWETITVGLVLVLLVRPLAGIVGLFDYPRERNVIAFFGIRGIGSFYYLAYGLNQTSFHDVELLWALVGFVAVVSIVLHGVTATPVMKALSRNQ